IHTLLSALVLLHLGFLLYRKLHTRLVMILTHMGICAFGIYLFHPAVLLIYRMKFMISTSPLVYHMMVFGGWVLAMGISWVLVALVNRYVKGSWIIFGQFPKMVKQTDIATTGQN